MKYIATISFGKDSTVMCDLLLKNNYPLDYIVFTDTLLEFPMMYEYKDKVCDYFKQRYCVDVIVTKPDSTFEDWCFGKIEDENARMNGFIRGIPMVWSEPCYWRREAKVKPQEKLFRDIGDHKIYIGFTLGEAQRRMSDDKFIYPLIDYFHMSERNCQEYLINQEMQNPLYNYFTRTGCSVCPAQSDKAWFVIWKHFPDTWEYMKNIEYRLSKFDKVKNRYWFNDFRSCEDMEKKFIKFDMQGSLFDFSDEPLKDCFCKI
ncbi:phosphoadenosine phosphosulfate reductase domain-containing protein [Sulfurimonas sp.]